MALDKKAYWKEVKASLAPAIAEDAGLASFVSMIDTSIESMSLEGLQSIAAAYNWYHGSPWEVKQGSDGKKKIVKKDKTPCRTATFMPGDRVNVHTCFPVMTAQVIGSKAAGQYLVRMETGHKVEVDEAELAPINSEVFN